MIQRFAFLLMLALLAAACGPDSKKLSVETDALGEKFLATTNEIIAFSQQVDVEKLIWRQQLDSLGASNNKVPAPTDTLQSALRRHIEGYEGLQNQINAFLGDWTAHNIRLSDLKAQLSEAKLSNAQAGEIKKAIAELTSAKDVAVAEMEKWKLSRAELHASCVKVMNAHAGATLNPKP